MNKNLTRRSFVKHSTLAAGVFAAAPFNILSAENAGNKIRCVQIGCGGRGLGAHLAACVNEHIVAIVDVDEAKLANVQKWYEGKGGDAAKLQKFTDYRQMFDKVGKDFDALFIATPNHQHALPAMIAMQMGK